MMAKEKKSDWHGLVFELGWDEFTDLANEVEMRECEHEIGFYDIFDMAWEVGRVPICPECGCEGHTLNGWTKDGERRYICDCCGRSYNLMSGSIFAYAKKHLREWGLVMKLMSWNLPVEAVAEIAGVHPNTALLWRRKAFEAVSGWQSGTVLSGTVWIDEIFQYDYYDPKDHFHKGKQGSAKKVCVCLAIDSSLRMRAFVAGKSRATSASIEDGLKGAIDPKATIIHDGLFQHRKLIKDLGCKDKVYKSTVKDEESLRAMLLVNSFCSWVHRYLARFYGMRPEYLQQYLDWFVYVFRVKQEQEKWPKTGRLIRHMLLSETTWTRKMRKERIFDE